MVAIADTILIPQTYVTEIEAIMWLFQCQWIYCEEYVYFNQNINLTFTSIVVISTMGKSNICATNCTLHATSCITRWNDKFNFHTIYILLLMVNARNTNHARATALISTAEELLSNKWKFRYLTWEPADTLVGLEPTIPRSHAVCSNFWYRNEPVCTHDWEYRLWRWK